MDLADEKVVNGLVMSSALIQYQNQEIRNFIFEHTGFILYTCRYCNLKFVE